MTVSMYQAAVPPLVRLLETLKHLLAKGEAHAAARQIEPSVLLGARLALDMLPLARQVQMVSDSAKGAGARLAGAALPSYPDTETSFPELQARLDKTIAFLKGLDEAAFAGAAEREVKMKAGASEYTFTGLDYLQTFALPNAFFHAVTAYNILRHNGVEVGKMDYLTGGRA
ncbi:MAG: DUF1993 domain-containing protein [Alphaproteobacteria bacterium]|mgnify:CR=1 FL=1|nr:DUF1993 domain-containing protein [Alphaproteobacteria bacterium]